MAKYIYGRYALTGGATGALDGIDGTNLADQDMAIVIVQGGVTLHYVLDVDSAETESIPNIIAPDSNGGDKRWKLQPMPPSALNLKIAVNATVNKLDIFSQSGGGAPDANNPIFVAIPNGSGNVFRRRGAAVLSGTSQFVMADGVDYWDKRSQLVPQTPLGLSSTRFDITNTAGSTYRYTYDGTGTNPGISATWPRVGDIIWCNAQNFSAANKGVFTITAVGANYFEVTNAGGLAENDKTVGTGIVAILNPKPAYVYAIWSSADSGIVFALAGYSGFNKVPTTTTNTDDDYFLLEDGSTYTRVGTDYCVCVGKVWQTYSTSDSPDSRFLAVNEYNPMVVWNPRSDYGYHKWLASSNTSASDIAEYSAVSVTIKQSGTYLIIGKAYATNVTPGYVSVNIRVGSATYGNAWNHASGDLGIAPYTGTSGIGTAVQSAICDIEAGDTVHLGVAVTGASGNRMVVGMSSMGGQQVVGETGLVFRRID